MRWKRSDEWWQGSKWPPRKWQAEALPAVVNSTEPAVTVQAVMGAGKSILLSELCAIAELENDEVIVVTTSSQALVVQLVGDIAGRVGMLNVGCYYTKVKQANRRIIVCCLPSARALAAKLNDLGRRVALWIADEAHRTECDGMLEAHEALAPARSVGFTATPYRAKKTEGLSLFSSLVYEYGPVQALRDGVVVRWEVVPWTGDEEVPLDDVCVEMCRRGVEEHGPGVVNASNIADAEAFAARLGEAGFAVDVVHSRRGLAANDDALEQLREGELEIIVHVSMLQEGVNLPFLRWLCLRRAVSSRVRFAQEVGRVLRTDEGKDKAVIYDPLDLFGEHSLSEEAVLAGGAQEVQEREPSLDDDALVLATRFRRKKVKPAEALDATTAYLRKLTLELEAVGALNRKIASKRWRSQEKTRKQFAFAKRMLDAVRRYVDTVPDEHRVALRAACYSVTEMNRGQIGDLIDVLKAIRSWKGWPLAAPEEMAA